LRVVAALARQIDVCVREVQYFNHGENPLPSMIGPFFWLEENFYISLIKN